MISKKSLKKSCRVSSPEGVAALFISAIIGLTMVALIPEKDRSQAAGEIAVDVKNVEQTENPEVVTDSAELSLRSVDLEKVIKFCIAHTTASRGFVVFSNGSCALVKEPSSDPVAEARAILASCAESDARFLSELTAEGDMIVTFKGSVFQWIPTDDIESMEEWSLANLDTLLSDSEREMSAPGWVPPAKARLGLISRKRLLDDAANGKVVKILRPNTSVAENTK